MAAARSLAEILEVFGTTPALRTTQLIAELGSGKKIAKPPVRNWKASSNNSPYSSSRQMSYSCTRCAPALRMVFVAAKPPGHSSRINPSNNNARLFRRSPPNAFDSLVESSQATVFYMTWRYRVNGTWPLYDQEVEYVTGNTLRLRSI
jgi:hypothetical protein